jgi:serine/threonine protein kinase
MVNTLFDREISVAKKMNSKYIIHVYEEIRIGSSKALVMEFVDGIDLSTLGNRLKNELPK